MSVKRWEITDSRGWQFCEEQRADGRWVKYEDYAALEARCRALEEAAKLPPILPRPDDRVRELEAALREAYQISHYGRGSMQDIDDVLERAIRPTPSGGTEHG